MRGGPPIVAPPAQALVTRFGGPLTTTSANRAGEPPATTPAAVDELFGAAAGSCDGGPTTGGAPSTLVRVRGETAEILRRGAIELSSEDLGGS